MPLLRAQPDHGPVVPYAAPGSGVHKLSSLLLLPRAAVTPRVPHLPFAPKSSDLGVPIFTKGANAALASLGHPREAGKALGWSCSAPDLESPGNGYVHGGYLDCINLGG